MVQVYDDTGEDVQLRTCTDPNCNSNGNEVEDLSAGKTANEQVSPGGSHTWMVMYTDGSYKCLTAGESDLKVDVSSAVECH